MSNPGRIDISKCEFEIKRHAFIRAMERGITPDMIEATLKGGKIVRHGKNRLKFFRQYKNFKVICVDHVKEERIIVVTIEVGR